MVRSKGSKSVKGWPLLTLNGPHYAYLVEGGGPPGIFSNSQTWQLGMEDTFFLRRVGKAASRGQVRLHVVIVICSSEPLVVMACFHVQQIQSILSSQEPQELGFVLS